MANKTIDDLTVNGTLTGSDTLELWQPSETVKSRKALLSSISKYVNDDSKTINNYSTFTKSYVPVIGEILYFNTVCTGHVGVNTIIGDGIKAVNALKFQEPVYVEAAAALDLTSTGLDINGNEVIVYNTSGGSILVTYDGSTSETIGAGASSNFTYLGAWYQRNSPPVGYVYTQFPTDNDPDELFWFGTWSNVSSEMSGDTIRFEGGNASAFESGEQSDALEDHYHEKSLSRATNGGTVSDTTVQQGDNTLVTSSVIVGNVSPTDAGSGAPSVAIETRMINRTVRKWRRAA